MMQPKHENLVDGKYSFKDLVDIEQLRNVFEQFSAATGFTTGLVSYPDQTPLIGTGWHDACAKFHRAFPISEIYCKASNEELTSNLKKQKSLNINRCASGLVDGATPIIVKGIHIANLFTGQIFFEKPDMDFFKKQGQTYGFDEASYLKAVTDVPVVTEGEFKKALNFLSEMAVMLADLGLTKLQNIETTQALQKSEDSHREILDNAQVGLFRATIDKGELIYCNDCFARLTGYPDKDSCISDYRGKEHYVHSEEREALHIKLAEVSNFSDVEVQITRGDGTPFWVTSTARLFSEHGYIEGSIIDITERKTAEAHLLSERTLTDIIIQSMPGLFYIFEKSSARFFRRNTNWARITGFTEDELDQMTALDCVVDKLLCAQRMQEVYEKGHSTMEGLLVTKSGKQIPYYFTGERLEVDGKIYLVGMAQDISERKFAEEKSTAKNMEYQRVNKELQASLEKIRIINKELEKAKEKAEESDILKTAFLANMSHEIRTPMNGILGFSDLLKSPELTVEERNQYIGIIEKSGNRMLNIINDLIDISKIEAGQIELNNEVHSANNLIDDMFAFFQPEAQAKNINFIAEKELPRDESYIAIDKARINQVLSNLIKNATKFTESGQIVFGYTKKDHYLQFYVRDTGIGMSPDVKEFVFERFRQADISSSRNYEGSGLGLSISKALVELHGGEIGVESVEGEGSVFWFTLPYQLSSSTVPALKPQKEYHKYDFIEGLKVLIVEDDEVNRLLLEKSLKSTKMNMLYAKDGKEALDMVAKHADLDLILMDIRMPHMSGLEATQVIKAKKPDMLIIAQTALAQLEDKQKALEAGFDDYITKPILKDHLLELIGKYKGIHTSD